MTTDFTKIHCFGEDCILITIREKAREPLLILTGQDINALNKEWNIQEHKVESKSLADQKSVGMKNPDNPSEINIEDKYGHRKEVNKDYQEKNGN